MHKQKKHTYMQHVRRDASVQLRREVLLAVAAGVLVPLRLL